MKPLISYYMWGIIGLIIGILIVVFGSIMLAFLYFMLKLEEEIERIKDEKKY